MSSAGVPGRSAETCPMGVRPRRTPSLTGLDLRLPREAEHPGITAAFRVLGHSRCRSRAKSEEDMSADLNMSVMPIQRPKAVVIVGCAALDDALASTALGSSSVERHFAAD